MPSSNLSPSLRCPRCQQPFRIPMDKMGLLLRCKSCDNRFRVSWDKAGELIVREDAGVPETLAPGSHPRPRPRPRLGSAANPSAPATTSPRPSPPGKPVAPLPPQPQPADVAPPPVLVSRLSWVGPLLAVVLALGAAGLAASTFLLR